MYYKTEKIEPFIVKRQSMSTGTISYIVSFDNKTKTFKTLEEAKKFKESVSLENYFLKEKNTCPSDISTEELLLKIFQLENGYNFSDKILPAWEIEKNIVKNFECALKHLTERQGYILKERIINKRTLSSLAEELDITKERIRQIEQKCIRRLLRKDLLMIIAFGEEISNYFISIERLRENLKNELLGFEDFYTKIKKGEINEEEFKVFIDNSKNLPIEYLDLCARSYNCLKRAGYSTIGQLIDKTEDDLFKIKNLGHKCAKEIIEKVKNYLTFEKTKV